MSDKKHDDQDEYRYPGDEQSGEMMPPDNDNTQQADGDEQSKIESTTESHSTKPGIDQLLKKIKKLPFLQNKRSVVIIIAIIVLFLLIKMIGGHNSPSSFSKTAKAVQEKAQPSLRTEYNVIGNQVHDLSTVVAQNKRGVQLLAENLQRLQQSMRSINDLVVQLTDEVSDLTKEVQTLKTQFKIQEAQRIKQQGIKPKIYYITAMVPGRAWIRSTDNIQIISVRVGDKLPTYGKVSSIDSDNGIIATTSGRIIKFGQNDS